MIRNLTDNHMLATKVRFCDTFLTRARGLMFHRPLAEDEALVFVEKRESISRAAIHMFFVFFPIAVIWLDAGKRVVDKVLARPFRPYYAPRKPAQYYVEGHPALLEQVQVGDLLEISPS
ncbi:MAG TPA: DUF192 domain-containing protein [Anaerolineae bacterium]|nr:DUF192 domain-containing protein [Anaerolineae bacterium]